MHSDEFKRWLAFSFTLIVLAENNFLPLLKSFINKTLKYKANLSLIWFVWLAMHFLVMNGHVTW